jgi:hypothetical protein
MKAALQIEEDRAALDKRADAEETRWKKLKECLEKDLRRAKS